MDMESSMDFLKLLDPDTSLMIFKLLDVPGDLVRVSAVSRAWQDFVIEHGLSKQLALKKYSQLSGVAQVALVSGTGIPNEVGSSSSMEWVNKKRDHTVFTSLVHSLESSAKGSCIVEAICASSTDNDPDESIDNTLIQSDSIEQRPSYWSSKGQHDPDVPERLVYKLKSSMCLISEIHIQPFRAYFQLGYPTYSAKFVRFRMGHPMSPVDLNLEYGQLAELTDQDFVWTYTSPEFPMSQENSLQKFQLPESALCVGGFLLIELLGRVQTQEMDNLYYICVAHVRADGVSLSPKFSVKTLKKSGNFVLEYNPQASVDAPVDAPVDAGTAIVDTRNVEAQGHQNWGQFMNMQILNMLQHYIPGYPNHYVEVEDDEEDEEFYNDDLVEDEEGDEELI